MQSYDSNVLQTLGYSRGIRPVVLFQAVGPCLFALAFIVPAGRLAVEGTSAWPGYFSAWWTLVNGYRFVARPDYNHYYEQLLLGISGLVSPLFALYILLSWWKKATSLRVVTLIVAFLLLIVANVTIFWSGHLLQQRVIPLAGHYFWTAGILISFLPEFFTPRSFSA